MIVGIGYITYWEDDDNNLTVGAWLKQIDETDMKTYYILSVDMDRYNELSKFGLDPTRDDLITGTFLTKPRRRYHKVPYFILMRTADRRRPDIDKILKMRGLDKYNQFELLLSTQGRYFSDKWRVLREPVNSINIPEEK